MIDYKDVGTRIRSVRKAREITQEQLAEAVGVGVTHISHIETGNSIPSLQVMIDIINCWTACRSRRGDSCRPHR